MRILHVNNWLPAPPIDGGKLRKLQQLSALARVHEVVVLGRAASPHDRRWLEARHPGLTVIEADAAADGSAATLDAVRRALSQVTVDAVHVSGVPQWPGTRDLDGRPIVLDVDSVESRVLETLCAAGVADITPLDVAAVRALERHAFTRASRVITCSDVDAALVRAAAPHADIAVAPNAIDVGAFRPSPLRPLHAPPLVTFTGFLAYRPNADACVHFVSRILPSVRAALGRVAVRLVGRLPPDDVRALQAAPGVEVVADVPDIRPYLEATDVVVVPLRAGSGTRLKILEAFAACRPVVSTSLGCEGLAVSDGTHLLITDDAEAFAAAVARVIRDRGLASDLATAGRALVEQRYDCGVVERDILGVYETLSRPNEDRPAPGAPA